MQDINENMDGLFRKAVDQYTLKPVDSKWDELSGKITSIKRPSSISDTIRSKYMKWVLLLAFIILIPVAIVSLIPGFNTHPGISKLKTAAVKLNKSKSANQNSKDEQKINAEQEANAGQKITAGEKAKQEPVYNLHNPSVKTTETAIHGNTIPDKTEFFIQENKKADLNTMDISSSSISEPAIKNIDGDLIRSYDLTLTPIYPAQANSVLDKNELLRLSVKSGNQKNLPLQHLDYPRRQGFYLGLVGGPMLTEVEHQGLKKSGFDFGLLAGYTISKKFSIETGLMYTKQYYFVSGKYYNEVAGVDNTSSLEGRRNAFEIPLTLKYNILRMAAGNFFLSAGASTFVGVSDKVLINVADGTIPPSQHFDYGITSYLPSYVNFSLGYEYKIGRFANLRIEPYLQIPLNSNPGNSFKTQVSGRSIQVFNTGIHIGISRFVR